MSRSLFSWASRLLFTRSRPAEIPPIRHPPAPSFSAVFHSTDHLRAIAAYLSIHDLLTASALCHSLHALFDSDAVWQDKLREAEAIQRVDGDVPVPAAALLSATQLAALPPLPTLAEAASLCEQSYLAAADFSQPPRLTAIVHLPSTLRYHARLIESFHGTREQLVACIEFVLSYSQHEQRWIVSSWGDRFSGWRTLKVDDNIGLDEQHSDDQLPHSPAAFGSSGSSKQRYIDLLQCSEHEHRQCWRLLPPSAPRLLRNYNQYHTKRIVLGLTRISASIYVAATSLFGNPRTFRVIITYTKRIPASSATGSEQSADSWREVDGYRVVARYGLANNVYEAQYNVCQQCQCGLTRSGKGHSEQCGKEEPKGLWKQLLPN